MPQVKKIEAPKNSQNHESLTIDSLLEASRELVEHSANLIHENGKLLTKSVEYENAFVNIAKAIDELAKTLNGEDKVRALAIAEMARSV